MLQDRSFFGGLSINVSDTLQKIPLVNALDVRITISAIGIVAYCTTRRTEVWTVRFALVEDLSRKSATPMSPAALIVDYKVQSHGDLYRDDDFGGDDSDDEEADESRMHEMALAHEFRLGRQSSERGTASHLGPTTVYNNYRKMQCVVYHTDKGFIDEMFQCLLPRWSFKRVDPSAPSVSVGYDGGHHSTRLSTSRRGTSGRVSFPSSGHSPVSTSPYHNTSQNDSRQQFSHLSRPTSSTISATQQGGFDTADSTLQDWAGGQLNKRHHAASRNVIEDQLTAIQHRRRERQRRLISHLQEGGQLQGLATSDVTRSFGAAADGRDSALPEDYSIENSFRLCPYCSKYGSAHHQHECQLRPVECSWCGQRMRFTEFPVHAVQCKPQQVAPPELPAPAKVPERGDLPTEPTPEKQVVAQPEPEPEIHGRQCRYCRKDKPKTHDPNCGEKKISCNVCHGVMLQKDKASHRASCNLRDNPRKLKSNATTVDRERMRSGAGGDGGSDAGSLRSSVVL